MPGDRVWRVSLGFSPSFPRFSCGVSAEAGDKQRRPPLLFLNDPRLGLHQPGNPLRTERAELRMVP